MRSQLASAASAASAMSAVERAGLITRTENQRYAFRFDSATRWPLTVGIGLKGS